MYQQRSPLLIPSFLFLSSIEKFVNFCPNEMISLQFSQSDFRWCAFLLYSTATLTLYKLWTLLWQSYDKLYSRFDFTVGIIEANLVHVVISLVKKWFKMFSYCRSVLCYKSLVESFLNVLMKNLNPARLNSVNVLNKFKKNCFVFMSLCTKSAQNAFYFWQDHSITKTSVGKIAYLRQ